MALLAPALQLRGFDAAVGGLLAQLGVLRWIRPWILKDGTDLQDPEQLAQAPVLAAWPSERLADVTRLQWAARRALPRIQAPALVLSAEEDLVVRHAAALEAVHLLVRSPEVRAVHLERGGHILPRDHDRARVADEVARFFTAAGRRHSGATHGRSLG